MEDGMGVGLGEVVWRPSRWLGPHHLVYMPCVRC